MWQRERGGGWGSLIESEPCGFFFFERQFNHSPPFSPMLETAAARSTLNPTTFRWEYNPLVGHNRLLFGTEARLLLLADPENETSRGNRELAPNAGRSDSGPRQSY